MNPLFEVRRLGQQVWLDNLSRTLLRDGQLERMIREDRIAGITTNPAIFEKAISAGRYYQEDLARLRREAMDAEGRYEQLAIADVRDACDLMREEFDASDGDAGYVSLEVSPALAHDAAATVAAARRLRAAVDRPNLLIKVPATPAGVEAIEELFADGVSVNVTLMFSLQHVDAVASAYERGVCRLLAAGGDARRLKSVASLFLSRVDTLVDKLLTELGGDANQLCGRSAVAMAKLAYQRYRERFDGASFAQLRSRGARPQHLLWASTGTKNATYSDLLYVEGLIGPETVNTMPDATLDALRNHGRAAATLGEGVSEANTCFEQLEGLGIDMAAIGEQLQREGLLQFETAFENLLAVAA